MHVFTSNHLTLIESAYGRQDTSQTLILLVCFAYFWRGWTLCDNVLIPTSLVGKFLSLDVGQLFHDVSSRTCMCACTHVCTHVCMYVSMYVHTYTPMYTHTYIFINFEKSCKLKCLFIVHSSNFPCTFLLHMYVLCTCTYYVHVHVRITYMYVLCTCTCTHYVHVHVHCTDSAFQVKLDVTHWRMY